MNIAQQLKASGDLTAIDLADLSKVATAMETQQQQKAMERRFCMHPNHADPELATEPVNRIARYLGCPDEQAEAIQLMHDRLGRSVGSGSWPAGCHPKLYPHSDSHATLLWIDRESFYKNDSLREAVTDEEWQGVVVDAKVWPDLDNPVQTVDEAKRLFSYETQDSRVAIFDRPEWREASGKQRGEPYSRFDMSTWLTLESHRRIGNFLFEVFTESETHNIHELMKAIWGGTSGYAYFPNGRCDDHVTSNIDLTLTYDLGRITGLRSHEFGHNEGFQHEFRRPQSTHRSIMSYAQDNWPFQGFRLAGAPYQYVEDHSWQVARKYFGGDAAKPILITDPGDDTPEGLIVAQHFDEASGQYVPGIRGEVFEGRAVFRGRVIVDCDAASGKHSMVLSPKGGNLYDFEPSF